MSKVTINPEWTSAANTKAEELKQQYLANPVYANDQNAVAKLNAGFLPYESGQKFSTFNGESENFARPEQSIGGGKMGQWLPVGNYVPLLKSEFNNWTMTETGTKSANLGKTQAELTGTQGALQTTTPTTTPTTPPPTNTSWNPNDKVVVQKGSDTRVVYYSQAIGFETGGFTILGRAKSEAVIGPTQNVNGVLLNSSTPPPAQTGNLPNDIAVQAALLGGQFDFETFNDLPAEIKNGKMWNLLDQEQKKLAYYVYKINLITNEKAKQNAQVALDKAIELADPFFKEQIKIAKTEVQQGIKGIEFSTESKLEQLQKDIADTEETLAFQKDNLNIEQQQELSMQLAQNKQQLFGLQQGMAEAGLAFSSPRKQAESDLLAQQQGISMSTKQRYGKAIEAANLQAKQAIANAQQSIGQTGEAKQLDLANLALNAEKLLGSTQAPDIAGTTKLGGISGQIEEERQSKILTLQDTLKNANTISL